jgi:hypothetical protein
VPQWSWDLNGGCSYCGHGGPSDEVLELDNDDLIDEWEGNHDAPGWADSDHGKGVWRAIQDRANLPEGEGGDDVYAWLNRWERKNRKNAAASKTRRQASSVGDWWPPVSQDEWGDPLAGAVGDDPMYGGAEDRYREFLNDHVIELTNEEIVDEFDRLSQDPGFEQTPLGQVMSQEMESRAEDAWESSHDPSMWSPKQGARPSKKQLGDKYGPGVQMGDYNGQSLPQGTVDHLNEIDKMLQEADGKITGHQDCDQCGRETGWRFDGPTGQMHCSECGQDWMDMHSRQNPGYMANRTAAQEFSDHIRTSDGYNFYRQPDGRFTDHPDGDPDLTDMSFTEDELRQSIEWEEIEVENVDPKQAGGPQETPQWNTYPNNPSLNPVFDIDPKQAARSAARPPVADHAFKPYSDDPERCVAELSDSGDTCNQLVEKHQMVPGEVLRDLRARGVFGSLRQAGEGCQECPDCDGEGCPSCSDDKTSRRQAVRVRIDTRLLHQLDDDRDDSGAGGAEELEFGSEDEALEHLNNLAADWDTDLVPAKGYVDYDGGEYDDDPDGTTYLFNGPVTDQERQGFATILHGWGGENWLADLDDPATRPRDLRKTPLGPRKRRPASRTAKMRIQVDNYYSDGRESQQVHDVDVEWPPASPSDGQWNPDDVHEQLSDQLFSYTGDGSGEDDDGAYHEVTVLSADDPSLVGKKFEYGL